jgi:hypothetical protein
MTSYRFQISTVFNNGLNVKKLTKEIKTDGSIKASLLDIRLDNNNSDVLVLTFDSALSADDKGSLYNVFKNHIGHSSGGRLIRSNGQITQVPSNQPSATNTSVANVVTNVVTNAVAKVGVEKSLSIAPRDGDPSSFVSGITTTEEDLVFNSANGNTSVDGYLSLNIGNNSNGGPVNIATSANSRDINIGNNTSGTTVYMRYFDSFFKSQSTETSLPDGTPASLQFTDVINHIIYGTPSVDTTINLFDADQITFYSTNFQINDAVDFTIINLSTTNSYILQPGASGSIIGNNTISPGISGLFRVKITSVVIGSESYVIYRVS